MFEVVIDNRNGTLWDVSRLVPEASWKTVRFGSAGMLQLKVVRNRTYQEPFVIEPGDVVRLRMNGVSLFYGYVFVIGESNEGEIEITAYDQIRYLLETDTYVRSNVTATQVIRDNALAVSLRVGALADTKHAIPAFAEDSQKRLDMIYKALDETLLANGRMYVLFDDAGSLMLRDIEDMTVEVIVGDGSLLYGYSYERNIDTDSYNRIKLVKDNQETGKREVYLAQDSGSIARWGRLQYHMKVNEKLNGAQINEMLSRLIRLKNREQRKFTLDALGYPGIRAGVKLQVTVKELGIHQYYLVENCTHRFKGGEHTMSLELKVYGP
jgi:hypothetical protein